MMKRTLTFFAALSMTAAAHSQTWQQEFCRTFAGLQRDVATLRDQGVSRKEAKIYHQQIIRQNNLGDLEEALLGAIDRTYDLNWTPQVTEVAAYAACIDGFRNP